MTECINRINYLHCIIIIMGNKLLHTEIPSEYVLEMESDLSQFSL